MARRMQNHNKNIRKQRRQKPKVTVYNGPECPDCGSRNLQFALSPMIMVCGKCLKEYPRGKVLLVV